MTNEHPNAYSELLQLVADHGAESVAVALSKLMQNAITLEQQNQRPGRPEHADESLQKPNETPSRQADAISSPHNFNTENASHLPAHNKPIDSYDPQALKRGTRTFRAAVTTLAQMYIQGAITRDVKKWLTDLNLLDVTSAQVDRATAGLDQELRAWRERPLDKTNYLILDACHQKVRHDGVVIDATLHSATGIDTEGKRRILGTSVSLGETKDPWHGFLGSLVARGMHGVSFVTSADHTGLNAARQDMLPSIPWQRCQHHLAQDAAQHCATQAIESQASDWLRLIFNAEDREQAEHTLDNAIKHFRATAPDLARWLEESVPDCFAVYALPAEHRKKMRTTKGVERPIQQQLKRHTRNIRVFPNIASLLRLATATLVEIDDDWNTATKRYIV